MGNFIVKFFKIIKKTTVIYFSLSFSWLFLWIDPYKLKDSLLGSIPPPRISLLSLGKQIEISHEVYTSHRICPHPSTSKTPAYSALGDYRTYYTFDFQVLGLQIVILLLGVWVVILFITWMELSWFLLSHFLCAIF